MSGRFVFKLMYRWKMSLTATHKRIDLMRSSSSKVAVRLYIEPSIAIKMFTRQDFFVLTSQKCSLWQYSTWDECIESCCCHMISSPRWTREPTAFGGPYRGQNEKVKCSTDGDPTGMEKWLQGTCVRVCVGSTLSFLAYSLCVYTHPNEHTLCL